MAEIQIPNNSIKLMVEKVCRDDSMIVGADFKQGSSKAIKVFILYLQTMYFYYLYLGVYG